MKLRHPYPDRQRCRACRSYFGFIVVQALFCSWECAGVPAPSWNPSHWPRGHYWFDPKTGKRQEKRWFFSLKEAQDAAAKQRGKGPYLCGYCATWHIGTPMEGRTP